MNRTIKLNHYYYVFAIPVLLTLAEILFVKSTLFKLHQNAFSIAATLDLIFSIPLVYFLLIHNKKIPNISVTIIFALGLIIASVIIPKNNQDLLTQIKLWIVPAVGIGIFSLIAFKVKNTVKAHKRDRIGKPDFYTTCKEAAASVLPSPISNLATAEISTTYYSFLSWRKRELNDNEFSYHKKSGTIALLAVLIFMILIESFVMNILLGLLSSSVAWLLSALSFYIAIHTFGILRSMSKRPITIENGALLLRYGIYNESTILLDDIESVETTHRKIGEKETVIKMTPLKNFEKHNVIINVKNENTLSGFYGTKKHFKTIAFYVDEVESFDKKLTSSMSQAHG